MATAGLGRELQPCLSRRDKEMGIGIVLAALAAGLLVGVAELPKVTSPITSVEVYQLGNAYGAAKAAAISYGALPLCGTPPCHSKSVLKQIDADVHVADAAYAQLVTYVRAHPAGSSVELTTLLAEAKDAIGVLQGAETQYGVK